MGAVLRHVPTANVIPRTCAMTWAGVHRIQTFWYFEPDFEPDLRLGPSRAVMNLISAIRRNRKKEICWSTNKQTFLSLAGPVVH